MHEVLIAQLQAENESLRKRVAELEHTLEVQEWGTQLFHESDIPQLLLDFETGAILAANAAARTFYGEELIGRGDIMCVCAEGLAGRAIFTRFSSRTATGSVCRSNTPHRARCESSRRISL